MAARIGSLCTGYGGLDMAVAEVFSGETVWVSDIDKGANKILAHRYADVPNLGDFTGIDWSTVSPIDILTAGFPCQPVSNAGKQLGDLDERWLWDDVARAVGALRPGLVVLENVRGLLTAGSGRLFGRVLGALAHLGYDAQWHGLRAADVGAAHGRFRVFIVAADTRSEAREQWSGLRPHDAARDGRGQSPRGSGTSLLPTPRATDGTKGGPNQRGSSGDLMLPSAVALLPTPTVQDGANTGGPSQFDRNSVPLNALVTLLPTPAVNDMGAGKTVEAWDEWTAKMQAAHGNGNGHGKSLAIEAQRLLPTPVTDPESANGHARNLGRETRLLPTPSAAEGGKTSRSGDRIGEPLIGGIVRDNLWGDYAAAIARWEAVIGRLAPAPTMTSTKGNPQLAPTFVEWLMGLPAGWVTDVPGITRNEALKALGNGVVPQQAAAALRHMLAMEAVA